MAEKRGGRRATTWGPGQGGRPPTPTDPVALAAVLEKKQAVKDIKEICQSYAPELLERALFWVRSDNATASAKCLELLMDRGYGKAPQRIEATGADGGPIQTQAVDERPPLDVLIAAAHAAVGGETKH